MLTIIIEMCKCITLKIKAWKFLKSNLKIWSIKNFQLYSSWISYCIPGIFRSVYISWLSVEPVFRSWNFADEGYPKLFVFFVSLLQGYIQRIYTNISSQIDKAPNQIVYHNQGNPRLPVESLGNQYCHGPVKVSSMTPPCFVKNIEQVHEMTHSTWPTVVPYFLEMTAY